MMIWCREFSDATYTDAAMRDVRRFRGIAFMFGRSLSGKFPTDAIIEISSKSAPTDFFMAGPYPVVSSKLKAILDKFSVNAEFMAVSLEGSGNRTISGAWFCFNVLETCDCFDRANSVFTPEQTFVTDIERIAMDETKCPTVPLALIKNVLPFLLIARDDLADEIVAERCTGVLFKRPDEWRNPVNPLPY